MVSYVAGGITMPIISAPLCVVNASLSLGKWVLNLLTAQSRQALKNINKYKFTNSQFQQKLNELEKIEEPGKQKDSRGKNTYVGSRASGFYESLKANKEDIGWSGKGYANLKEQNFFAGCLTTQSKIEKIKKLLNEEIRQNDCEIFDLNKYRYQPELNAKNTLYFAIATIPLIGYTLAEKFGPKATWVN